MNGLTGTAAAIAALQASVDAACGYPRPGVPCGPGYHQPGGGVTTSASAPIQNQQTATLWALPVTAEVNAQLTGPQKAAVIALDATWFPVAAVDAGQTVVG